eukprot:scaffold338_cov361-Pavlova_lutheri.AAC.7
MMPTASPRRTWNEHPCSTVLVPKDLCTSLSSKSTSERLAFRPFNVGLAIAIVAIVAIDPSQPSERINSPGSIREMRTEGRRIGYVHGTCVHGLNARTTQAVERWISRGIEP